MDTPSADILSTTKQALLTIRRLKQQLADAERGQPGDVAIVSMACRFPKQSETPEKFWESLMEGRDEVSEIPADRWDLKAFYDEDPEAPGKMYARHGVFLDRLDLMDPEFFGISPREATWVDPQQRLLLETSWEALERAGWTPSRIGESTGVFIGWMHNDYQNEASDSFLNLNPYIATGAAGSFLSGRLAYYLGLQGPSVAVDTACSSSLVALHLACQSLLRHECDRAIVGGVNAIVAPTTNILTCKLKALSPNGHSRAFDAAADGYLRGEGCGVVAVRRLADAERDRDPILGIIRGSAVGHNGFSSGLTAPNPRAQERVIRQALERARVTPELVSYLEAHGTGTELGDPIELQAAAAAYADKRDHSHPLLVGSVKTNIGHLEAAAGMAGLIKTLLALQFGKIPAQLNFEVPNPHVPWDQMPLQVVTEATDWPDSERRLAGVSAFGMSGTNAHVIVEAPKRSDGSRSPVNGYTLAPAAEDSSRSFRSEPQLLVLSGKSEDALYDSIERYCEFLQNYPDADLGDVACTSGVGRSHFEHRAAVVATQSSQVPDVLEALLRGSADDHARLGQHRTAPKTAWQFTGQGSQYLGMTRQLYDAQPVFREAIDQCDRWLSAHRSGSLRNVMFENEGSLHHTSWTQPAIFAVQMGLVQLLNSWGLRPDVVMGHSVGQYAAACVAGIFSWEDGLKLIAERGRLIGNLPAGGGMLAVFAPAGRLEKLLRLFPEISLAALNGTHVVVSGPLERLAEMESDLSAQQIRCKRLKTSHAFHSALMDPVLEEFRTFADSFTPRPARLPLVCNVTGKLLPPEQPFDGKYWSRHIRAAVCYSESLQTLQELGCELLLEVGPQAVLTNMARGCWTGDADALIHCLQREQDDRESLLSAIGQLYVHGVTPDFAAMHAHSDRRRVLLPTYPFQRRRFWGPAKARAFYAEKHTAHPLLGEECALAGLPNQTRFESHIEPDSPAWLSDHQVMEQVLLPGAALVEMALVACEGARLTDLNFEQPLQPRGRTAVQTVLNRSDDGDARIEIYSAPDQSSEWTRHFRAAVGGPVESVESVESAESAEATVDREAIRANCRHSFPGDEFYLRMQGLGLDYGPQFQTVQSVAYSEHEVLAELKSTGDLRGYRLPPTLLDGALHCLAVGMFHEDGDSLFLPVGMESFECSGAAATEVWCHGKWLEREGLIRTADVTLFDAQGTVIAKVGKLRVREIDRRVLRKMSDSGSRSLVHEVRWQPYRQPTKSEQTHPWLVIAPSAELAPHAGGFASQLCQFLKDDGHQPVEVALSASADCNPRDVAWPRFEIVNPDADDWSRLLQQAADQVSGFRPAGVIWIPGSPNQSTFDARSIPPHHELTRINVQSFLGLLKALQHTGIRELAGGFQWITHQAMAVEETSRETDDATVDVSQSEYWGLGRVLAAEFPDYKTRLIDLESALSDISETGLKTLLEAVCNESREGQMAIRDGRFLVPRLTEVNLTDESGDTVPVRADASYLITGGLGKLGLEAAQWLAQQGATQLVLVSRREPDAPTQQTIDELHNHGCRVDVCSADLGSPHDVEQLFARFGSDLPQLYGILHAAGVLDDGLLIDQTWERFEKVLAPKVIGASLLHQHSQSQPLDFFILYSSAAAVLGSPGQSNYAMANAYLDGLAVHRRSSGHPALSVNWGPWELGMADDEKIIKRLALQGITPLTVSDAHRSLSKMLSGQFVQATVMDAEWSRMRWGPGGETPTLLEKLAETKQTRQAGDSQLVLKLKQLGGSQRREKLLTTIRSELKQILGTPDDPETDRPLIEMGLDSLMAVEFGTRLQMLLGDNLPVAPTMLFEFPTIDAITDHVLTLMEDHPGTGEEPGSTGQPTQAVKPQTGRDDVAIIGMSCRFPGAKNLRQFWDNLLNGVDSVREIPADRWDVDRFYSPEPEVGKMYTKEGGYLEDVADFDAAFFNISDQEACWIDPQHRLLLENTWNALEDAGIAADAIDDRNVGVFMGIMSQDYAFLPSLEDRGVIEAFAGAGLAHSAGVGRISHFFGFEGPCVAVDTASSSSLVAVIQAVRNLLDGHCHLALAGGANAILSPANTLLMSKAGMLSPDGRCKSFSADADGFGRGEGCGVVVLKRLRDAERDGDRILAVIRGGAVSHNGMSGGLTTPNTRSQVKVISEALNEAGISPADVQYLEAHGTGTEYGDPMELTAAAGVLGKGRRDPLLVGSVKANISHLEAAGGISGLIKTVLAMQHGVIPRQLHFESPSPHIPWDRLPLRMVTERTPWPETEERVAGVTALGLSGTNAHVVLSSKQTTATAIQDPKQRRSQQILVLSAKSQQSLRQLVEEYADALSSTPADRFADFCCTLGAGRQHFDRRAAVVVNSKEQAISELQLIARTQTGRSAENGHPRSESESFPSAKSPPKLNWVFGDITGGAQIFQKLVEDEPEFRSSVEKLTEQFSEELNLPTGTENAIPGVSHNQTDVITFLLHYGLAELWKSWGIEPDSLMGFGVGQYTAAHLAGVLSPEDALQLVIRRAEIRERFGMQISNMEFEGQSHPELDAALDEFEGFADTLNCFPPDRPLVCSLTSECVPVHRQLGGSYWRRHCVESPQVRESWQQLLKLEDDVIMDFSTADPDDSLTSVVSETSHLPVFLRCVAGDAPASEQQLDCLAALYVRGAKVDFRSFYRSGSFRKLSLPTYPFQKKRYWITDLNRTAEGGSRVQVTKD